MAHSPVGFTSGLFPFIAPTLNSPSFPSFTASLSVMITSCLEIPRCGKFYQVPGLKHTSDIFHVLTAQSFIICSSPLTGGTPGAYKNKQTNKRSRVHCPFTVELNLSARSTIILPHLRTDNN